MIHWTLTRILTGIEELLHVQQKHVMPQAQASSIFALEPRNPVESSLNPCGDAFQIGRRDVQCCQARLTMIWQTC